MGTNLSPLIKETKKIVTIKNFVGKRIAIDAFILMHQFANSAKSHDGKPLRDRHGNITSHLSGFFYRTIYLRENNIYPIYVFDGKANILKSEEIKKRRASKEIIDHKYREVQDIGTDEEKNKYFSAPKIRRNMIDDAKELLKLLGTCVVQAPQDGESQCSELVSTGKAFCVNSKDYDSFLFGAKRVVRNLSKTKTRKMYGRTIGVDIEYYSLEKILTNLDITHSQLIDIGLLTGTDFTKGIKGIGPKTALKLVKKYNSIENIHKENAKIGDNLIIQDYENIIKAKNIFTNPVVNKDIKIKFNKPNYKGIIEFLLERDFNKERVEKKVKYFKDKISTKRQTTMNDFFN